LRELLVRLSPKAGRISYSLLIQLVRRTGLMSAGQVSLFRLKVFAEANSGALMRTLERFQNIGVMPRRVVAELTSGDMLCIQVDVAGIDESRLSLIANKLAQTPCVMRSYWHYA
jgi:hypothetical protein